MDAMKTMEIDAVVTTGPNLRVTDVRAAHNVHVLESAPHDAVMKDVSVVISQGGHGTVCRALINGVPQLVLPTGRDQADNAARVEAKGVGLRLPSTASADDISAAVSKLVNELPFRIAARRSGKAIRNEMAAFCARCGDGGDRRRPQSRLSGANDITNAAAAGAVFAYVTGSSLFFITALGMPGSHPRRSGAPSLPHPG
jgi:hypothetical protein